VNYQPSSAPATYYGAKETGGGTATFVLVLVGIVMALVGKIVMAMMFKVDDSDAVENLMVVSSIFAAIGGALAAMGLTWGVLKGTEFSDNIRVGLGVAAGIAIGLYCAGGLGLLSMLGLM